MLLIGILVAVIIGRRKVTRAEDVSTGLAHSVGGLTLINIAIAALRLRYGEVMALSLWTCLKIHPRSVKEP